MIGFPPSAAVFQVGNTTSKWAAAERMKFPPIDHKVVVIHESTLKAACCPLSNTKCNRAKEGKSSAMTIHHALSASLRPPEDCAMRL